MARHDQPHHSKPHHSTPHLSTPHLSTSHRSTSHRNTSQPTILGFLADLADSLCRAVADDGGNVLVHVAPAADGNDVGILDLDGRPPADVLLGMVAPDEWIALGVATRARARPLEAGQGALDAPGPAEVVVLVHRVGDVVSRVRLGASVLCDPPSHGLTLDGLQRALGLPTAPPLVETGALYASTWLQGVVQAASDQSAALTWPNVCALHPAIQLAGDHRLEATAEELVVAARALERVCDWERLRWLAVRGGWQEPSVTPSDAAWFDDGAFSRWVLDHRPPIELLLREVELLAGPSIANRCAATLRQLRIPSAGEGLSVA